MLHPPRPEAQKRRLLLRLIQGALTIHYYYPLRRTRKVGVVKEVPAAGERATARSRRSRGTSRSSRGTRDAARGEPEGARLGSNERRARSEMGTRDGRARRRCRRRRGERASEGRDRRGNRRRRRRRRESAAQRRGGAAPHRVGRTAARWRMSAAVSSLARTRVSELQRDTVRRIVGFLYVQIVPASITETSAVPTAQSTPVGIDGCESKTSKRL